MILTIFMITKSLPADSFHSLFNPRSIAIIGASHNLIGGSKYLFGLKSAGYFTTGGKVYLINPKLTELFGLSVFPSIKDPRIPNPIDLAIVAVPAVVVPQILQECHQRVKFAVIYTSGFGEAGNETLDVALRHSIQQIDTRIIGPNGLGILNPYSKVAIYPEWENYCVSISYVAQSGGTMVRLYLCLGPLGLGFHNVVSIGNSYDININDLLPYFDADPLTKVIALYMESIPDGRQFYQLAQKIVHNKPIVLWKGGQSERGSKAAFSHTGGMAGEYQIWKAMCRQSGILLADHFELFMDLIQIATIRPVTPHDLRVAVVVAGGGISVEFTDLLSSEGFEVPELTRKTIKALQDLFPAVNTMFSNPVDLGELGYDPRLFGKALEIVAEDSNISSIVFVREPERFKITAQLLKIPDAQQLTLDSLKNLIQKVSKPLICNPSMNMDNAEGYQTRHDFQTKMIAAGIPVINYIGNIPRVLKQLYYYGKALEKKI